MVILDISLPDADGVAGIRSLRVAHPEIPIVVMTGQISGVLMLETLVNGAQGFIPKSAISNRLRAALNLVSAGGRYIPEELLSFLAGDPAHCHTPNALNSACWNCRSVAGLSTPREEADICSSSFRPISAETVQPSNSQVLLDELVQQLTTRQREVLKLLANGFSNKEIARKLSLSTGTIKNHVAAILTTLKTPSRAKLISHFYTANAESL